MPLLPRIASLWRNLVRARRVERDLDDELHSAVDHEPLARNQPGCDESSSQFGREYSRLFGAPPQRDARSALSQ